MMTLKCRRKHVGAGRPRVQWIWKRQNTASRRRVAERLVWVLSK